MLDFADGKVRLVAVRAYHGGPLVGHELQDIKRHMPNLECRIPAIYRRDRGIVPKGITVIEPDDEVFFLARKQDIPVGDARAAPHGTPGQEGHDRRRRQYRAAAGGANRARLRRQGH